MQKVNVVFTLAVLLAFAGLSDSTSSTVLIWNEDDSNFADGGDFTFDGVRRYPLDEKGLRAYVDFIASSNKITHFFICTGARSSSIDTRTIEPAWHHIDDSRYVKSPYDNCWYKLKELHDKRVDYPAVWIDECRRKGVSPWLSFRMNDAHLTGAHTRRRMIHPLLWVTNSTYALYPDMRPLQRGFDFKYAYIRQLKVAYVREVLQRYDVDGIEIDWMRFPNVFLPHEAAQNAHLLTEMMSEIRRLCQDRAQALGHPVRLCVRVPPRFKDCAYFGYDVLAWVRKGLVDWVVPCNFWGNCDFEMPVAEWVAAVRAANPNAQVLPGTDIHWTGGSTELTYREYAAFAARAYQQGANGVYCFNLFDLGFKNETLLRLVHEGLPRDRVGELGKGHAADDGQYDCEPSAGPCGSR